MLNSSYVLSKQALVLISAVTVNKSRKKCGTVHIKGSDRKRKSLPTILSGAAYSLAAIFGYDFVAAPQGKRRHQ